MLLVIMLRVLMLGVAFSIIMLNVGRYAEYHYAESCYGECGYAERCYAECPYSESFYGVCPCAESCYAECSYAESCYAECPYAESCYAECCPALADRCIIVGPKSENYIHISFFPFLVLPPEAEVARVWIKPPIVSSGKASTLIPDVRYQLLPGWTAQFPRNGYTREPSPKGKAQYS